MDIAFLLIASIIPLYILMALGWISGRYLDVNLPSMATIAIYILAPIVNFGALARMDFDPAYISLPIIIFGFSAAIGTLAYHAAHKCWGNNSANLIGMGAVTGNTMYFGMPLILTLLGPEWVGVYALMNLGCFLNEVGLGYYFGARGTADVKGALLKVARFPVIHAIWLGLLVNILNIPVPSVFYQYWDYALGAWVIIGMMLIGVALSKQTRLELDWRLIGWMGGTKFLLWPLAGAAFIAVDMAWLHAFGPVIHQMLLIFTTVPLAGNLVAYAATFNLHAERAAGAVLVTTLLAVTTVPMALFLYQLFT